MEETSLNIMVNGAEHHLPAPLNVAQLLETLQVPATGGVAVLLNGEIARRKDWDDTALSPGDELEIVRATVGG